MYIEDNSAKNRPENGWKPRKNVQFTSSIVHLGRFFPICCATSEEFSSFVAQHLRNFFPICCATDQASTPHPSGVLRISDSDRGMGGRERGGGRGRDWLFWVLNFLLVYINVNGTALFTGMPSKPWRRSSTAPGVHLAPWLFLPSPRGP